MFSSHMIKTSIPMSLGATAPLLGLLTSVFMQKCQHTMCSLSVTHENNPVTRMTDMTMQNNYNGVGNTQAPSQFRVTIVR